MSLVDPNHFYHLIVTSMLEHTFCQVWKYFWEGIKSHSNFFCTIWGSSEPAPRNIFKLLKTINLDMMIRKILETIELSDWERSIFSVQLGNQVR